MYTNVALSRLLGSLPGLVEATYAQEAAERPAAGADKALQVGQLLTATVVQRLGADRSLASINGQIYNLRLPAPAEAGQELQLEVVDRQPQLLFRLVSALQAASESAPGVNLSDTARWLQSATSSLLEAGSPTARDRVDPVPLLQRPPETAIPLADSLRSAVTRSGIFYESHQALWLEGRFTLDALRQEPQATPTSAATQASRGLATPAGTSPFSTSAAIPTGDVTQPQPTTIRNEQSALVERQLAALAGGPIEWCGFAWPGQDIRLSVQRDKQPGLFADPGLNGWQTHLTLDLPQLGSVNASLHLSHAGVRISIDVDDTTSLEAIRASGRELIDTLSGLGIKVLALGLHHAG